MISVSDIISKVLLAGDKLMPLALLTVQCIQFTKTLRTNTKN